MIFHFVKIMDDLELFNKKHQKYASMMTFFGGNSSNIIQKIWGVNKSKNVEILEFQKV